MKTPPLPEDAEYLDDDPRSQGFPADYPDDEDNDTIPDDDDPYPDEWEPFEDEDDLDDDEEYD